MDIPKPVEEICAHYCRELLTELPGVVVGIYIIGSIALGDFQPGTSDIDFVTVVNRALNKDDLARLASVHAGISKAYPRQSAEGIYVLPEQLGRSAQELPPIPGYHEGRLSTGYFAINPVTWYELKTFALTVYGREVATLDFAASFERLRSYSKDNINTYWRKWVDSISKPGSRNSIYALLSREAVAWGVLGVTRLYHVIVEGSAVSKSGAGEYALAHLPQWHKIVTEALQVRRGITRSEYRNPFARRRELIQYMNSIIEICNQTS